MRKVISTILKIVTVPFAIFGAGVFFQVVRYGIAFFKEHANDYGSSEEEMRRLGNDGAVCYFEDLADRARNL